MTSTSTSERGHGGGEDVGQGGDAGGPDGRRGRIAVSHQGGDIAGVDAAGGWPVAAAYRSAIARAEATASSVLPGATRIWPISPARNVAPGRITPSITTAAAEPVPIGTNSAEPAPAAAPNVASATAPVRTSWPTFTGTTEPLGEPLPHGHVAPAHRHRKVGRPRSRRRSRERRHRPRRRRGELGSTRRRDRRRRRRCCRARRRGRAVGRVGTRRSTRSPAGPRIPAFSDVPPTSTATTARRSRPLTLSVAQGRG